MPPFTRRGLFWIGCILLIDSALAIAQSAGGVDLYGGMLPTGAVARIQSGRLRQQATGEIFEIAISPSGNYLAASSYRHGGITLWDPATGEQLALPPVRGQGPLVFSADGKRLAARGRSERGTLLVFDPVKGLELLRYCPLPDTDIGAFSYQPFMLTPNGQVLLVAVESKIRFVNVASGKHERTIDIGDVAHRLMIAPNGSSLAIGCADKSIRLWDIVGGKEIHRLGGHSGRIGSMTFTRDSKTLITGDNDGSVHIWDTGSGNRLDVLKTDVSSVQAMAVSDDGKHLVLGGQGRSVELWDLPRRKLLARTPPHYAPVWSIAFTPDGKRVAWGDQSSSVRMAEVIDNNLRLITPGKLVTRDLAFKGDGNSIITVGDGTIHVWESATGKEVRRVHEQDFEIRALAHAPALNRFALACSDGTLRLREEIGGKDIWKLPGLDRSLHAVAMSADGKWLATSGGAMIHVCDLATGRQVHKLVQHRGAVTAVSFSPDGSFLASANEDHTVRVWDRATGTELRQFAEHKCPVTCVAIAPGGKLAASGSWDGVVRLWDPATAKQLARLDAHRENVSAVAFAPVGDRIATAGWDGVVRVWDYAGKEVARFDGHKDEISALAFAPDGKRLASASRDHTVLVWQLPGQ